MPEDDVTIRLRTRGAQRAAAEARDVADAVEDIGDATKKTRTEGKLWQDAQGRWRAANGRFASSAEKAAAGIDRQTAAIERNQRALKAHPFARDAWRLATSRWTLAAVGAVGATSRMLPVLDQLVSRSARLSVGLAGAGGVLGSAVAQGAGTAALALWEVSDALGGNADALKRLTPAQRTFVGQLREMEPLVKRMRETAAAGLLPGLGAGLTAASRNAGRVNTVIGQTSGVLGGLSKQAGGMLGSAAWGADITRLGAANARIIGDLGQGTLHLANATRALLAEAAPLAEWLARNAREGARLLDVWVAQKRATGDLARYYQGAQRDLAMLARQGRDVWRDIGAAGGPGAYLEQQAPKLASAVVDAMAQALVTGAPRAAGLFIDAFVGAGAWGKLMMGTWLAAKLGGFKVAGKLVGDQIAARAGGGVSSALGQRVFVTNWPPGLMAPNAPIPGGPSSPARTAGRIGSTAAKAAAAARAAGPAGAAAAAGAAAGGAIDRATGGGGSRARNEGQPGMVGGIGGSVVDQVRNIIGSLFSAEPARKGATTGEALTRVANPLQPIVIQVDGRTIATATAGAAAHAKARR